MGLPAKSFVPLDEYLALELTAEYKNEYWNGQIFAMSGGSSAHCLLAGNSGDTLRRQLGKKGCLVYGSDLRVRTSASGLYTYPDLSVVCGKSKFATRAENTLLNPVLLAEVTSPGTERYDRVGKFALYSDIPTLREYLLISSTEVCVERYLRPPGGKWQLTKATSLKDSIQLASVPAILKLRDLYKNVNFPRD